MAGTKRTKFDDDTLNFIENNLMAVIRVIHQTQYGASMQQAINFEGLDMHTVRSILYSALNLNNNKTKPVKVKDFRDMTYTPVERLYKDIFGYSDTEWINGNFTLPSDAEKTLNYIILQLKDQEQTAIKLYYFDEMTLEEAGKELNVTRDRVRQIIAKALRKLRNPTRSNILRDGLEKRENMIAAKARIEKETTEKYLREYKEKLESEQKEKQQNPTIWLEEKIEELDLSIRSYNCLRRAGIYTIKEIFVKTNEELRCIRNLGRKSVDEIKEKVTKYLYAKDLSLKDMITIKEKLRKETLKYGLWDDNLD